MSRRAPFPVAQAWAFALPLQQQSVLLLACRFADGVRKDHPFKPLHRAYRGVVLNAARYGRPLRMGTGGDSFMALPMSWDALREAAIPVIGDGVDDLPHHYLLHFIHGAEIIGYKHPDRATRRFWSEIYGLFVESQHMFPETEKELDARLGDWDHVDWDAEEAP